VNPANDLIVAGFTASKSNSDQDAPYLTGNDCDVLNSGAKINLKERQKANGYSYY